MVSDRFNVHRTWSESDIPFGDAVGVDIMGRIWHAEVEDLSTGAQAEGTGWSEEEAIQVAIIEGFGLDPDFP